MPENDVIEQFDKKVVSIWIVIALGASEFVKHTLALIAREWVTVIVFGLDVTMIALAATLVTAGTTAIIAYKTIGV